MVMQKFGGKQVAFRSPGEDFQVGSGGGGGGGGGEYERVSVTILGGAN